MSGNQVFNQPYDQMHELSDESQIDQSVDDAVLSPGPAKPQDDDSNSSSDDSSGSEDNGPPRQGLVYNPDDFKDLKVSSDIQDCFNHIGHHTPQNIELESILKPFIPEFIPAVGDIDAFVKVPRPDNKKDSLGLVVLDEPAAQQTDPTVLEIMLKQISKTTNIISVAVAVRSIENADKNPQKITTWVKEIDRVHRGKPLPSVHYSKPMPDIEQLMQVWPPQFEEMLRKVSLPTHEIKLDVAEYARVVCAILDIPVYEKITESLHVLFTLYSEFKNNSHFQS
jgi:intraflagellar transport protein 46